MARIRSRLNRAFGERRSGRVVNVRERGGGRFNSRRFRALGDRLSQQQSGFNQRSEARFNQLLQLGQQARTRALAAQGQALAASKRISGIRQEEITRFGTQATAQGQQSLISRGLGNTTIQESVNRGIASDVSRRRRSVDADQALRESSILQGTAGLESQLGQFQADLFLSRNDQNPAFNETLELLRQLSQR